jgi:hypothetical protein
MIKRLTIIFFLVFSACSVFSQTDTSAAVAPARPVYRFRDSASLARWMARKDSIQAAKDSIKAFRYALQMEFIKAPDPNRTNQFVDSLLALYEVKNADFVAWAKKFPKRENKLDTGKVRTKGEIWVVAFVVFLLLFFAILKNAFSKELGTIIQSFYSNRVLAQISKEDTLFNSWPFIFLYILFGFTIGMFIYLCVKYYGLVYTYDGFQWFAILSGIVLGLFTMKIILLRILGFLFDIQKMVREYVSILYLSYFNSAILFLPLVVAFSLTPNRFAQAYIYLGVILLTGIFVFQFVRAGANILSNYRFSKTYLFIYLCALEICPLLVLIKALRL